MRKEYRKAVRDLFTASLAETIPGLAPARIRSPILFGGEGTFAWTPSSALHCYVILVPDLKGREAFTVEIGWSTRARFPEVTARPSMLLSARELDPMNVPEAIVRLGDLHDGHDAWWALPDPASENPGDVAALAKSLEPMSDDDARRAAASPVAAAMAVLSATGVPFMQALAERHCGQSLSPGELTV